MMCVCVVCDYCTSCVGVLYVVCMSCECCVDELCFFLRMMFVCRGAYMMCGRLLCDLLELAFL